MYVLYRSNHFKVTRDDIGAEIKPLTDPSVRSIYLQGDEATELETSFTELEAAWTDVLSRYGDWYWPNGKAKYHEFGDRLLADYFGDPVTSPTTTRRV